MAGLIENTKRGHFKITQLGKDTLAQNPPEINLKFLKQFPGYLENAGRVKEEETTITTDENGQVGATPEEILENIYVNIRRNLAQELLSKIKSCSPSFFENLVVELLVKMGYGGTIQVFFEERNSPGWGAVSLSCVSFEDARTVLRILSIPALHP